MRTIYLTAILFTTLTASIAWATPEYSERTNQGCLICHLSASGGQTNETGLVYSASGYMWPPSGGYRVLGPIRKYMRLAIGYIHITASFIWFGAILYVHILLRPGYASKGLPKGEVILGLVSMSVVGVTGLLLTISRIRGFEVLYTSRWGVLLSIKIGLYLVMLSTALIAVGFVGPRLRRLSKSPQHVPDDGVFNPMTLAYFNGKEGRPAYIAYKGDVYDVGGLRHWSGGLHMKHHAGDDMTAPLSKAPHGEEKLDPLKKVGKFDAGHKPPLRPEQKAFYAIAYMNLGLVFVVLFVISCLRWWH